MAPQSAGARARYCRAAACVHQRRDSRLDRLSQDPPAIRKKTGGLGGCRCRKFRTIFERRAATMTARALIFVSLLLASVSVIGCARQSNTVAADPLRTAYDSEPDWNDPQRVIPLNYQQAQGKRIFYEQCVWCHADSTPAGPSNRSNLTPVPPLLNDGAALNAESDQNLQNIITLGGSAVGKSAMMPPY